MAFGRGRHWVAAALMLALVSGAKGARLDVFIADQRGGAVQNAVVTLRPAIATSVPPRPASEVEIEQVGQRFVPRVVAVPIGTWVKFPNRDPIRHHVYSFSPAKRFEIKLFKGDEADPVFFDKPGLVAIGCNIHDWMSGYVYVSDDPYFATTDNEGRADWDGLPSGEYRATIWHPDLLQEPRETTLTINGDQSFAAELKIARVSQSPEPNSLTARFRANASR